MLLLGVGGGGGFTTLLVLSLGGVGVGIALRQTLCVPSSDREESAASTASSCARLRAILQNNYYYCEPL